MISEGFFFFPWNKTAGPSTLSVIQVLELQL